MNNVNKVGINYPLRNTETSQMFRGQKPNLNEPYTTCDQSFLPVFAATEEMVEA